MKALVKNQHEFLVFESAKNTIGITVLYWESLEAIKKLETTCAST